MPPFPSDPPLSPALQALFDLFEEEAAELKFPGLDAQTLDAAADRVRVHAGALRNAEAVCEAARSLLQESQEALLQQGHRALAYLRIYAEEKPELTARLDAIALPRPLRRTARMEGTGASEPLDRAAEAPKRRGRPPRLKSDALFATEPSAPADAPAS